MGKFTVFSSSSFSLQSILSTLLKTISKVTGFPCSLGSGLVEAPRPKSLGCCSGGDCPGIWPGLAVGSDGGLGREVALNPAPAPRVRARCISALALTLPAVTPLLDPLGALLKRSIVALVVDVYTDQDPSCNPATPPNLEPRGWGCISRDDKKMEPQSQKSFFCQTCCKQFSYRSKYERHLISSSHLRFSRSLRISIRPPQAQEESELDVPSSSGTDLEGSQDMNWEFIGIFILHAMNKLPFCQISCECGFKMTLFIDPLDHYEACMPSPGFSS